MRKILIKIYIYIYQPYGSQNFPDFLIITKKYIIPLETKFSSKDNGKNLPKWNSNIPKPNAIYLFASQTYEKPILFLGNDYISHNITNEYLKYFDEFDQKNKLKELYKKVKNLENTYNPFGLYPKIRTDYLTNNDFIFGNDDKLDIYQFSIKMKWRENVLNFLESLNDEE